MRVSPESLTFEQLTEAQYPLVKKFYKAARYSNRIARNDDVYVVRLQHQIVAAARIVKSHDVFMLRSMVVASELRQVGVGSFLLQHLTPALGLKACWCYPFSWLEEFYRSAGFELKHETDCPQWIVDKYKGYRAQGRDIKIMCKPAYFTCP